MTAPALVEQIIASHAGRDGVTPGELVTAKVDRVYLQDGNSPTIATLFEKHGFSGVFDRDRVGIFFDHSVIAPDKHIAARLREAERLAERLGVRVFRAGEGISHVVALEEGWYEPGTIVIGSDFAHLHRRRDPEPGARNGRFGLYGGDGHRRNLAAGAGDDLDRR